MDTPPKLKVLGAIALCIAGAMLGPLKAEGLPPQALDGEWLFQHAPDAKAAENFEKFYEAAADVSGFRRLKVPSNWAMQGVEEPLYTLISNGEGFYVHTFEVPAAAEGQRVVLHFDGAWQSSEVWWNGKHIGRRDSGFTAFAFDVTAEVKAGAANRLAVRLRQQTRFAGMDANDDWSLPGIYRGVWLEFLPKPFNLERIEVVTDFDTDYRDADLRVRALVARYERGHPWESVSQPVEVRAILTDKSGVIVQQGAATGRLTGGRTDRDVPLTLRISSPAPWTAETPNLYDLRVELLVEGKVVHARTERVGFREVSTTGGVLRVNGQAVKLRGVTRHDLAAEVGRATRPEDWRADLLAMRAANINTVRTSHYPPAEGFIRLCDELGFYVIDEVPTGLFIGFEHPDAVNEGLSRVNETVQRDRNRPSVIIWSLGNEDPLTQFHITGARALKGIDPTRPILLPWRAEPDLPPEFDILAPHYRTAEEYDRMTAAATRPLISTEYTHALGPEDFGGLEDRWKAIVRHPAGAGATIWEWADQGLRRPINGRPVLHPELDMPKYIQRGSDLVRARQLGVNEILDVRGYYGGDGIVDGDRTPQRDYWETRAVYSPVQVLTTRLPLAHGQAIVSIPVRNVYDFTDLNTVKAGWTLFRDGEKLAEGSAALAAPPHTDTKLVVPTTAITAGAPAGNYYLHLTFADAAGMELTRHSVRLGDRVSLNDPPMPSAAKPVVAQSAETVTVEAGGSRYQFNPATGQLTSVEWGGERVLHGADIVVWRAPTQSERGALLTRKVQRPWDTILQGLPAKASQFAVQERDGAVAITANTRYQGEGQNSVSVAYRYEISARGVLRVTFAVRPELTDVDALPEIGLEFRSDGAVRELAWLGLGPGDSLPNRHASALFGLWRMPWAGAADAVRPRWGVERVDLSLANGRQVQIEGGSGFRLVPEANGGRRLRLLSHQAGAWTKFAPAERPEWRLDLKPGSVFEGEFVFTPIDDRR